jgi:hypothetical protein
LLATVLELLDLFHRDDDLVDAVLHVHALDSGAEVGGDLLLVAGLGVHDVPGTRTGPGVVDHLGLGFGLIGDLFVGEVERDVDRIDVGFGRIDVGFGRIEGGDDVGVGEGEFGERFVVHVSRTTMWRALRRASRDRRRRRCR